MKRLINGLLIAATSILLGCLYLPFIDSPPVFDDHGVLDADVALHYATHPFPLVSRSLPYFTLGFVKVISNDAISWNRATNIGILFSLALATFFFLRRAAQTEENGIFNRRAILVCCAVTLWFTVNPVAVYGTAYIAQRTILLATLFTVLAANLYLRAHRENRNIDLLSSALCSALAMLCKEHAVLTPFAIIALTPLATAWTALSLRRVLIYLALLMPACLWTLSHGAIEPGSAYEINAAVILDQFSSTQTFGPFPDLWMMSAATQTGLFLRYAAVWLWPNPSHLSADIRIDFETLWAGYVGYALAIGTIALVALCSLVFFKPRYKQSVKLISSGLLFSAVMFVVELSVVRIQEPFVLYRSMLWAPGYALFATGLFIWSFEKMEQMRPTLTTPALILILLAPILILPWSINRLESFGSEKALWADAMEKLPRLETPGADRIYYNLAGEAFKSKDYPEALRFSDMVVQQNPKAFYGYLGRATALMALGQLQLAEEAFDAAEKQPKPDKFNGYIQFKRCILHELKGEKSAVEPCIQKSAEMGYGQAITLLKLRGTSPH